MNCRVRDRNGQSGANTVHHGDTEHRDTEKIKSRRNRLEKTIRIEKVP